MFRKEKIGMKKLLPLLILIFSTVNVYALLDDNSTNLKQDQKQVSDNTNINKNLQGQDQLQKQVQGQAQAAVAVQGQGQLGIVGQSAENDQTTNVGGDTNKTTANAWPGLSGGEGVSQANAYSVFGGLGLSNTEAYRKYIVQIQAIEASQLLTDTDKKTMVKYLFYKMMDTNKTQRLLGILWETSGRNLSNLFGILSWDSFWRDR